MTDLPCCHSRFHPGSATRAPGRVAWAVAACLGAACGLAQAQAQPAGGLDWTLSAAGAAEANVSKLGVIAGWTQPAPLWQGAQWRLRLRHELELAAWRVPKARDLLELGYSPVLRLERPLRESRRRKLVCVWQVACLLLCLLPAIGGAWGQDGVIGAPAWSADGRRLVAAREHLAVAAVAVHPHAAADRCWPGDAAPTVPPVWPVSHWRRGALHPPGHPRSAAPSRPRWGVPGRAAGR